MSLESNSNSRIKMSYISIYESSESIGELFVDYCYFLVGNTTTIKVLRDDEDLDSCNSSLIERDSDATVDGSSAKDVDSDEVEV